MGYPPIEVPPELETILLVEDETLVRLGLAEFLRESGYRVFEAADAREALEVLRSGPSFDLVIADVRLPGNIDGVELGRRIRKLWPETKIIVTSGIVPPEEKPEGDLGGPLLVKPYTRRHLLDRVKEALNVKREPRGREAP